jgi:hypothetical protein
MQARSRRSRTCSAAGARSCSCDSRV